MRRDVMPTHERLLTADEFARVPNDEYHYELVEGRLVRMSPPGARHGLLATRAAMLLAQYVDAHDLGAVITTSGFTLARNPDTVREPDIAFVRRDRIPDTGVPDGFWPGAPDLVVEIRSPGDRSGEIRAKVDDYLARGVTEIWVLDPRTSTVTTYRRGVPPLTLGLDDVLNGGDAVPGFVCPVRLIFEQANRAP